MTRSEQNKIPFLWTSILILMLATSLSRAAEDQRSSDRTAANESIPLISSETSVEKNPVQQFRELLDMNRAERRQALSNRPPEIARQIMAKLREYESLKPDERELRLQATELRWYLMPLMTGSRSNRAEQLAKIPEPHRKIIEARLEQWDLLPPAYQEELLNSEVTSRYFTQLESANAAQRKKLLSQMSPERRAKLEAGLDIWRILPPEHRQKMLRSFNEFFELKPEEKMRVLGQLSDAEKQQMEKTLAAYEKLTPRQRAECIESFQKFASMSLAERQAFLKNAERWKLMSAEEREEWRRLVEVAPIQPPLPIGFSPPMPPPPMPVFPPMATN